jgi:hypothetical protein
MQAQAAEFSGYAGKFRCFFGEKSLKILAGVASSESTGRRSVPLCFFKLGKAGRFAYIEVKSLH